MATTTATVTVVVRRGPGATMPSAKQVRREGRKQASKEGKGDKGVPMIYGARGTRGLKSTKDIY